MPFPSVATHLAVVGGEVERQYVAWFQQPGVAEAEMDSRVRVILSRTLRTGVPLEEVLRFALSTGSLDMNPFLHAERWPVLGEPLGTPADLDHYCRVFERTGFRGGINWYRNIDRNARRLPDVGTTRLDLPCLMITAEWDPALPPETAARMPEICSDLEMHMIEKCGHWTQQEKPEDLSRLMLGWLSRRFEQQGGNPR